MDQYQADTATGADTRQGPLMVCRADDLRDFLQQLSDQIADADRRQSESLRDMRERLARIGAETGALKAGLPKAAAAEVERLEGGIAHLAQRIDEAQDRDSASPHDRPDEPHAARAAMHAQPPALRSAVVAGAKTEEKPQAPMPSIDEEPWDDAAAAALTHLYDSGEAQLPKMRHPVEIEAHMQPPASASAPAAPAAALAPGLLGAQAPAFAPQAAAAADREWLETRLDDIAARVERSLADLQPDQSMAEFGRRFDELEQHLADALSEVATRSDVEGLRIVEAHISELTSRLEQMQAQMARLDGMERQLSALGAQLSDDQIVRLFGSLVPTEDDLTRFAENAAEKVAARLVSEHPSAMPAVSGPVSSGIDDGSAERISALQQMLAGFIDERRRGEAETSEALETMQDAMQRVLERVDAIETARPAPAPVAPAAHADIAAVAHHLQAAVATSEPRLEPAPRIDAFEEAKAAAKAAAAAAGRGAQAARGHDPRAAMRAGDRIEPTMSMPERMDEIPARQGAAPGRQDAPPRNAVEAARRAATRARPQDEARPAAPAAKPAGIRDRLLGAAGDGKKGIPAAALLVPTIACLLVAGFLLFYPKHRPLAPATAGIQRTLPEAAAPAATTAPANPAGPAIDTDAVPAKPAATEPEAKPDSALKPRAATSSGDLEGQHNAGETASAEAGVSSAGLGIAVQQTREPTEAELLRARERMRLASLSQQTARNAAATSALAPHVVPASLQEAAPAAAPAPEGKTVIDLPPALVGPLSLRLAAAKGDPSAQFEVAARFAEGKGIKQDFVQAAAWYQRAATQGLPAAQYRLAALFERGLGVTADAARARVWYKRAAEQGNVKAMHNLAVLSAGREKGTPDYPSAVQWFSEAAERGLSDSQYNLGVLYESGLGVSKDAATAYKWYSIAARSGDKEAIRRRDILRARFDAIALQSAEETIASWRPRPIEQAANDAIAAGTAWKARAAGTAAN